MEEHASSSSGVWLVLAKKGTARPTSLTYDQALEEALCHGWVDGQLARADAGTFRRRFTPRRAGSAWSKRNTTLAERLVVEGRMRPAGLAVVERAKAASTRRDRPAEARRRWRSGVGHCTGIRRAKCRKTECTTIGPVGTLTIRTDVEVERALVELTQGGKSRSEVARAAILEAERAQRRARLRAEAEGLRSDPEDVAASRTMAAEMEALHAW
ncbi:MAG: hypothetical protein M0Z46_06710 [Actinomycetota bacterium]|jgi:hypothetical protein|nr:hypothetical protein [Actinomycetota bacterium]